MESLTLVSYVAQSGNIRTLGLRLESSVLMFESILDEQGAIHWRPQYEHVPAAAYAAYEEESLT